jgi:aryl-alcohol dehydrogenase-like predicted oxidoreductase
MSLGEAWADILPPLNQEKSFALLDAWYEAGGVHIDTSNHYQVSHTLDRSEDR